MRDKVYKINKVRYANIGNRRISEIKLQGKWLEDLGFGVGDKFEVSAEKGTIVLKVIEIIDPKMDET